MAQIKDMIVNGSAKFNGSVESDRPFKGNLSGNATSANILNAVLSADVIGNNKYYYIGSLHAKVTNLYHSIQNLQYMIKILTRLGLSWSYILSTALIIHGK